MGAKKVLDSFGMRATRKPEVLARQLADAVNRHGEQAMYRIASVHPDLELITEFNEYNAKREAKADSSKEKETSLFSSAEGQAIKSAVEDIKRRQEFSNMVGNTPKEVRSEKTELLIIGAIALVGLALVLKK